MHMEIMICDMILTKNHIFCIRRTTDLKLRVLKFASYTSESLYYIFTSIFPSP
uniref:Uncharacterized protein n=1 Tax=Arundo donax TaxID=35708 RepID=A0A0A9DVR0_ARUDO